MSPSFAGTDFSIPAKPAELESASSGWSVDALVDVASAGVEDLLKQAAERVADDAGALAEQATFSLAYSALRSFASLPAAAQTQTCRLAASAVTHAAKACKHALLESSTSLAQARATLKAAVYLQVWLIQEAEKVAAKAALSASASAKLPARGKSSKKIAAKEVEVWSWDEHRETAALRLLEALELSLKELWAHRPIDEAFIVLFSRAANAMLEQPAALKSGAASLREALWRLVALPAVHYGQHEATVSALVKLLLGSEHAPTHLAELMQRLLDEYEAVPLVADFLRELTTLPPSDMGGDAGGPKNLATFLHAFAVRAPLMLVANLHLIQPHLGSESYALRCGAVSTHGQLLIQVSQMSGAKPPEVEEAADKLLEVPLKRISDQSSFVRSRALQTLGLLAEARTLPMARFAEVAELSLQRLSDKHANVRKGALQLFSTLLEFNPFGPSLSRTLLEARRDELQKLVPPKQEQVPAMIEGAEQDEEEQPKTEEEQPKTEVAEVAEVASAAPKLDEEVALEMMEVALAFEAVIQSRLGDVMKLLGSSTSGDVIEAMNAVVTSHSFDIEGARPAVVLTLVWSRDSSVRTAALQAAQSIWLRLSATNGRGSLTQAIETGRALFTLFDAANLAELTSLEEVMTEWQRQKLLPSALITILWDVLQGSRPELAGAAERRASLALLNMAAMGDSQLLRCKFELLLRAVQGASSDLVLARHACVALQRCTASGLIAPKAARAATKALEELLSSEPAAEHAEAWFGAAEQAIETIYVLSDAPEDLMTAVLQKLGTEVTSDGGDGTISEGVLSRLLFCLGHVALKTLVHIEATDKMLQKRRAAEAANRGMPAAAEGAPKPATGKAGATNEEEEDDLAAVGGGGAAGAEADSDYLVVLGEKLLAPGSLLGSWAPLVSAVCLNADGLFGADVRAAASLTMCKLMCVSGAYCEEQLQLLFTVLQRETEQGIRANIAISLGDLAVRHPNVLERWTARIYAQLRDPEPRVRKNVLMVLTHLILNGMVKVKGQVSELALCLLDTDERISSLSHFFFSEFAKLDAVAIYNLLPDIVSSLTSDDDLPQESFREVLSVLMGKDFIGKDKQVESLVEKLCKRFDDSDKPRVHQEIAFCLGALSHTDKSIRKLLELKKSYANKLGDEEVHGYFIGLAQKTRRLPGAKVELKSALDDLEAFLSESTQQAADEGVAATAAAAQPVVEAAASAAEPAHKPAAKPPAPKKAASRRGRAKRMDEADDEHDADENALPKVTTEKSSAKASSKVAAEASAPPARRASRRV